jgi:hypothetical protein
MQELMRSHMAYAIVLDSKELPMGICTLYLKIYPGFLAVNFATLKGVLYSTVDGTPAFKIRIF